MFAPSSVNASVLKKVLELWLFACLKTFEGHLKSVLKTNWIHARQRVASESVGCENLDNH